MDNDPSAARRQVSQRPGELPARRAQDAGARQEPGARGGLHAGRPARGIQPRQGENPAEHPAAAARLVQGQSEQIHLRPASQFRARPHLSHGAALSPRRQGPERPVEGLGQDLGLPEGAQPLHRVLPDRDRHHHEGARRRLARHDRHRHRLGHQSARARHRAEELQGRRIRQHDLGERHAVPDGAEGAVAGKARRGSRPDGVPPQA